VQIAGGLRLRIDGIDHADEPTVRRVLQGGFAGKRNEWFDVRIFDDR